MIKKVLIIGGEGYIGQVVCPYLVDKGFNVTTYDDLIYGHKNNKPDLQKNYNFIQGNLNDTKIINELISNFDAVLILAGLVGDPITKKYPEIANKTNYYGIKNIIDQCIVSKIKKIIFISTCSNYGLISENELADENFELNPLSNYAQDKVKIENYIKALKNKTESCITTLRFATAFGLSPRMRFDLTINEFVLELIKGNKLQVYDAETWRPYCHVVDFSRIINKILISDIDKIYFQTFNAGSNRNNFTKKMIVNEILKIIKNDEIEYIEQPGADARNYRVDFSKLESTLDIKCEYSVLDGIKEIVEAVKGESKYLKLDKLNFGNYNIINEN